MSTGPKKEDMEAMTKAFNHTLQKLGLVPSNYSPDVVKMWFAIFMGGAMYGTQDIAQRIQAAVERSK